MLLLRPVQPQPRAAASPSAEPLERAAGCPNHEAAAARTASPQKLRAEVSLFRSWIATF